MSYYGGMIALEDLRNNSICVKTSEGIRNIKNEYELDDFPVFVSNVVPLDGELKIVKKGEMVRYKNVHVFK